MSLLHRRLEPSADIAPLRVQELDETRDYCRGEVDRLVQENPRLDDQGIKESILNAPACPALIKRVSLERPSVFDLLCSKTRYRQDFFDMQRTMLLQMEKGTLSEKDAFDRMFRHMIPNSGVILQDLQKAAAAAQTQANIQ